MLKVSFFISKNNMNNVSYKLFYLLRLLLHIRYTQPVVIKIPAAHPPLQGISAAGIKTHLFT